MNTAYFLLLALVLLANFASGSLIVEDENLNEKKLVAKGNLVDPLDSGIIDSLAVTDSPTLTPTRSPTLKPSPSPSTRRPTRRPTERKSIYGDFTPDKVLDYSDQQNTVIVLIIAIFVFMACEVAAPEIIMLTALMIVIFCEILTLSEGLAGKP